MRTLNSKKEETSPMEEFDDIFEDDNMGAKEEKVELTRSELDSLRRLKRKEDSQTALIEARSRLDSDPEYIAMKCELDEETLWDEALGSVKDEELEDSDNTSEQEETEDGEELEDSEDLESLEDDEDPKEKKANKVLTGVIVAFIVALGCVGGYYVYDNFMGNDTKVASSEELTTKMSDMYTSNRKDDVKAWVTTEKVSEYLSKLDTFTDLDAEKKATLKGELETISYYLADKEIVENMNSSSYDLDSSDKSSNLTRLKASVDNYTIPGLALSISNGITKFESDDNYYQAVSEELMGISDVLSFDYESSIAKVNKVTHKVNKEDLTSICDKMKQNKKDAEEVEKLKKQATEEASKKAEELQKQTEEQLKSLQGEIDSLKNKLTNGTSETSVEGSETTPTEETN